jgi:energy-coupling factor transporter ATP-binding protein EcfA2
LPVVVVAPNDRYAIVGKTGSGKTKFAIVLAAYFARTLPAPWEVHWIDTKNDPEDLRTLRQWGFRNIASQRDRQTSVLQNALYWYVEGSDEMYDEETVGQVQEICRRCYLQRYCVVCIDEYTQAVVSKQNPGPALKDIFTRGRGRNVGIIGLTQEPVYVPRQLLSQASHQVLFTVSYDYDVDYLRKIDKVYQPPGKLGDPYGFWWRWVDGQTETTYYPNQQEWFEQFEVAVPRQMEGANG